METRRCEVRGNSDTGSAGDSGALENPACSEEVKTLVKHCSVPHTKQNLSVVQFQARSNSWFLVREREKEDQADSQLIVNILHVRDRAHTDWTDSDL